MAAIRGSNTKPELIVRRGLHARGFRFRLHDRKLPGKPDIVLTRYRAVIFVNGCFWHAHGCSLFRWPSTRQDFWRAKIGGNAERDRKNSAALRSAGWRIATVWECALKGRNRIDPATVIDSLSAWLSSDADFLDLAGTDTHPTADPGNAGSTQL